MPYLFGNLAEVVDESDDGRLLQRVFDAVDVDVALVEEIVEHVDGVDGARTLLLVPEDQVDPFVQVRAHIVALQRLRTHHVM